MRKSGINDVLRLYNDITSRVIGWAVVDRIYVKSCRHKQKLFINRIVGG